MTITSVSFDKGTMSAPAFLDLIVKDADGKLHKVTLKGKAAKKLAHLSVGDSYEA